MKILILGASSGFGKEFVKLLAKDNNHVIAISNDKIGLDLLKKELLNNKNVELETHCMDLTLENDLNSLCEKFTDCDFLINSAGGGKIGGTTDLNLEQESYYLNLNIKAFHRVTKCAVTKMIQTGHGRILNVCSTASFVPMPNFSIYAATKAFCASYTLALAKEVEKYNVKIMALCPGPTRTNFLKQDHYDKIKKKFFNLPIFMYPDKVTRNALNKFLNKNQIMYIPGVLNKIIYFIDKFLSTKFKNNTIYNTYKDI